MNHYSLWPLMWKAACGAPGEPAPRLVGELALVDCPGCKKVVVKAEILGRKIGA